jgi:hypothetical protein
VSIAQTAVGDAEPVGSIAFVAYPMPTGIQDGNMLMGVFSTISPALDVGNSGLEQSSNGKQQEKEEVQSL